jgi:Na+(H+)/acetate symporter ActP
MNLDRYNHHPTLPLRVALLMVSCLAGLGVLLWLSAVNGWTYVAIALAILWITAAMVMAIMIVLAHVASGSPDVNGDPERDSAEIVSSSLSWDHGSARTAASRPPSSVRRTETITTNPITQ